MVDSSSSGSEGNCVAGDSNDENSEEIIENPGSEGRTLVVPVVVGRLVAMLYVVVAGDGCCGWDEVDRRRHSSPNAIPFVVIEVVETETNC